MNEKIPEALAVLDQGIDNLLDSGHVRNVLDMQKACAAFAKLVVRLDAYLDNSTLCNRMNLIDALAAVEVLPK